MTIAFPLGSIDDPEYMAGMCHMLEHLIFSNDVTKKLVNLGAICNAYTSYDTTVFYVKTHSEYALNAMRLYYNMIFDYDPRTLTHAALEKEKRIVLEEISKRDDNDHDIHLLLKDTLYNRPIGGSKKTLANIKLADVIAFYEKMYKKKYAYISITCPSSIRASLKIANKTIPTDHETYRRLFRRPNNSIVYQIPEHLIVKSKHSPSRLYITYRAFAFSDPRHVVMDFIQNVLAGDFHSILMQDVRMKKGMIYNAEVYNQSFEYAGIFQIRITTLSDIYAFYWIVKKHIDGLMDGIIDFNIHKKRYIERCLLTLKDDMQNATHVCEHQRNNTDHTTYINQIKMMTPELVKSTCKKVFGDQLHFFQIMGDLTKAQIATIKGK